MKEPTAHIDGEMLLPRRGTKCLFLNIQPRQRLHMRHKLGYSPVWAQNTAGDGHRKTGKR